MRSFRYVEAELNSRRWFGVVDVGSVVKLAVVGVAAALLGAWLALVFPRDKYAYNRLHPYTSWMPIVAYVVARNLWPALRCRYVHLFAWLGKITLETYLSQLHILLQSNAKHLIAYIAGYPLLNFALATVVYLTASYRLFHVTTEFSAFLLPRDRRLMLRNVGIFVFLIVVSTAVAWFLRTFDVA